MPDRAARPPADVSDAYFEQAFAAGPVMGIFRGLDPRATVAACEQAWALGVQVVEIPVQSPSAVPSLQAAIAAARERSLTVGAGSVIGRDQVETVIECGAAFAVAPGLHEKVVQACRERGLPHLPGVATASEIARARDLGHIWVKAFPASLLTPGWVRAQLAWAPGTRFVATGGVDAGNAADFLDVGCRAVAVGSALSDDEQMHRLAALTSKVVR